MNREILFRGKRVIDPIKIERYAPDGWVYGGLLEGDGEMYILPYDISGEMYINKPYRFRANDFDCSVMLAKVDPQSVGQFTGLKDKNGKKIFEGDILKTEIYYDCGCYPHSETRRFEVKIPDIFIKNICGKREVIGNIYDNKELLK